MSNELTQELNVLHLTQQTGLLLIHLGNQVATVGLVSGDIAYFFYDRLTNAAAVSAFHHAYRSQSTPLRWRFRKGSVTPSEHESALSFSEVLTALQPPQTNQGYRGTERVTQAREKAATGRYVTELAL